MSESRVEELGVVVDNTFGNQPKMKAKQCNKKLKIYREFGLATLSCLVRKKEGKQDDSIPIRACDAISGTGLAGLQWKKHLQDHVHVTLADHDSLSHLGINSTSNSINPVETKLNATRTPGDPVPNQGPSEIHMCQATAKTLLMMEAFQFIFLNPHKSCVGFIDPAFESIGNRGIICIVVPDISVFARTTQVVRRWYAADVIKTEYLKELAARVVLASMARAASRCNKGIQPLYVVSVEDYLLICVRVSRGYGVSDASIDEIAQLMHCRFCEERVFMENQLAPEENPYEKLPCKCKEINHWKTAVLIGPVWKGPIFNAEFLSQLVEHGRELKLCSQFTSLASLLLSESLCVPNFHKTLLPLDNTNPSDKTKPASVEDSSVSTDSSNKNCLASERADETKEKECEKFISGDSPSETDLGGCKRQIENVSDCEAHGQSKKLKQDESSSQRDSSHNTIQGINVPFYYNVNKCKKDKIPKLDKLVSKLNSAGFKSSRTHFDSSAIRTSATVEQFLQHASI